MERIEKTVVKNSAIKEMLKQNKPKTEQKKNKKSYERYRGKNNTKPMSYYLSDDIIIALNIRAARTGKYKSDIVAEVLEKELKEELDELKEK